MKQDLATAYRQMKSPNIKTRKRALKLIHEAKRAKKNNRCNWTHIVGLFFYVRLSPVQRYSYYNSIRRILQNTI